MSKGKLQTQYLLCKVERNHLGKANPNGLYGEEQDRITFVHHKTFYFKQEALDYISEYTSYTDFIIQETYMSIDSD